MLRVGSEGYILARLYSSSSSHCQRGQTFTAMRLGQTITAYFVLRLFALFCCTAGRRVLITICAVRHWLGWAFSVTSPPSETDGHYHMLELDHHRVLKENTLVLVCSAALKRVSDYRLVRFSVSSPPALTDDHCHMLRVSWTVTPATLFSLRWGTGPFCCLPVR